MNLYIKVFSRGHRVYGDKYMHEISGQVCIEVRFERHFLGPLNIES